MITFKLYHYINILSSYFWISLLWNLENHVLHKSITEITIFSEPPPSPVEPGARLPPRKRWTSPSEGWFKNTHGTLELYWWYIYIYISWIVWVVTSTFWCIGLHIYTYIHSMCVLKTHITLMHSCTCNTHAQYSWHMQTHIRTFVCSCVNMDIGTWMDVGNFCNPSDSKNMWCS